MRIESAIQDLRKWFPKAQETFPKREGTKLSSVVSRELRSELTRILDALDPVLTRLQKDDAGKLHKKLQTAIEHQMFFSYDAGNQINEKALLRYSTWIQSNLIRVLGQCYDYFDSASPNERPGAQDDADQIGETPVINDNATYTPRQVAHISGLPYETVRKRLERLRQHDHDCFVETENPKRGEPTFLYKGYAVRSILGG